MCTRSGHYCIADSMTAGSAALLPAAAATTSDNADASPSSGKQQEGLTEAEKLGKTGTSSSCSRVVAHACCAGSADTHSACVECHVK